MEGGTEMKKGLVPYPHVADKFGRYMSATEVPPKEWLVQTAHQNPQPTVLMPERQFPLTFGYKNSRYCGQVRQRVFWSPRQYLLMGPHTQLLRLPPSELQYWGSSLKGTRNTWGETELYGIRAKARGQLSARRKWWQRPLFLFWALLPKSQQVGTVSETPSTWLSLFASPW